MQIGILALQGAFIEHERMLDKLHISHHQIRNKEDLSIPMDGIILPGGESTAIGKLLTDLNMMESLRFLIASGLPAMGTCAGLILLARTTLNNGFPSIGTLDITVKRNAYGRQLGSFKTTESIAGIGDFPMVFIRAPYIEKVGESVQVLSTHDGKIVAAKSESQIVSAFHPELTDDPRFHQLFIRLCQTFLEKRNSQ